MSYVLRTQPERVTARGVQRPAEYLRRINYPGLLTGKPCTFTATRALPDALVYDTAEDVGAAVALLHSIGIVPDVVTVWACCTSSIGPTCQHQKGA